MVRMFWTTTEYKKMPLYDICDNNQGDSHVEAESYAEAIEIWMEHWETEEEPEMVILLNKNNVLRKPLVLGAKIIDDVDDED